MDVLQDATARSNAINRTAPEARLTGDVFLFGEDNMGGILHTGPAKDNEEKQALRPCGWCQGLIFGGASVELPIEDARKLEW